MLEYHLPFEVGVDFSKQNHVALRSNYKIKITPHKHTIHSKILSNANNWKDLLILFILLFPIYRSLGNKD